MAVYCPAYGTGLLALQQAVRVFVSRLRRGGSFGLGWHRLRYRRRCVFDIIGVAGEAVVPGIYLEPNPEVLGQSAVGDLDPRAMSALAEATRYSLELHGGSG